ncbi:MAG: hypothetical protein Q9209_003933 [Squamulea sp. 1 TL-2023]
MTSDPLEELLELEDTYYKEGYDLGIQDGSCTGRIEGRLFGLTSTFEKFSNMGTLHGRSIIWSHRLPTSQPVLEPAEVSNHQEALALKAPSTGSRAIRQESGLLGHPPASISTSLPHIPHNPRLERHIRTLYALTEPASLSTDNNEDAVSDFNDRLKRAEGKVKIIEKLLGEKTISGSTQHHEDSSEIDLTSNKADFLVFDRERGAEILGSDPSYDFVFEVSEAVHEAPVYVASQNKLLFSQLAPPPGYLPQLVVDLYQDPPTLSEYLSDPPVYGGTFHNGLIYWGASGGNNSIGGIEQRTGLRKLDPLTNKSTTILNNYFGYYFNTVDDLFVHPNGDIWFTDPGQSSHIHSPNIQLNINPRANPPTSDYGWFNNLTDTPPQLPPATYRFRPTTGAVIIVEDTLAQPNGIALAPNNRTVYISDTGATSGPTPPFLPSLGATFNATGKRTIYAFGLSHDATYLSNKRAFYLSQDSAPDGLKVARNGYVVTGAGKGVDVLSEIGEGADELYGAEFRVGGGGVAGVLDSGGGGRVEG